MNDGLPLLLADGNTAHVVEVRENHARLRSPSPSPPGSTVRGHLEKHPGDPFELKVRSCKRDWEQEQPVFVIDGKLQNATRVLKRVLHGVHERQGAPRQG